jgi:hypothetical protein
MTINAIKSAEQDHSHCADIKTDATVGNRQSMDIELSTFESDHVSDENASNDKRPLMVLPPSATAAKILLEKETNVSANAVWPRRTTVAAETENGLWDDTNNSRTGLLSNLILQEIKKHYLQTAIRQQRPCCSLRRIVALVLAILPLAVFVLETTTRSTANNNNDENCRRCILLSHWKVETCIGMVAVFGGFGALLYSNEYWNYSLARWLGGFIASLGSLLTIWMVSQNLAGDSNFLFVLWVSLFVGILGTMPGIVVYFVAKIATDEWFATSFDVHDGLGCGYSTLTTHLISVTTTAEGY